MKTLTKQIIYKNKVYDIVFNLNVMEEIQEKYGSLDKWAKLTSSNKGSEPNAKAVIFGFTAMINEGLEISNETNNENNSLLTEKQVGRMITDIGLKESTSKLQETVIESTNTEEKN